MKKYKLTIPEIADLVEKFSSIRDRTDLELAIEEEVRINEQCAPKN